MTEQRPQGGPGHDPPLTPRLLKPADAARLLAIGRRKLWELTHRRAIPHIRVGRALRYSVADLEVWIATHTVRERSR